MTRYRPPSVSFSSGEISPLLFGRTDYQRYRTGTRTMRGFLPLREGGFTRAPGTIMRGNTRNNLFCRRIRFEFSKDDALSLEFTDGIMRVWRYNVLVNSGGSPYELATPYDEAAIMRLKYVQSADVIYLADGVLPIQRLSRFALDSWTIEEMQPQNGPFRVQNLDEGKTIQASASIGIGIVLTGVGDPFQPEHVGSLFQLKPVDFTAIPIFTTNTTAAVGDKFRVGDNVYEMTAGTNTGAVIPEFDSGEQLTDKAKGCVFKYVSNNVGIVRISAVFNSNSAIANVIKHIPDACVSDPTYRWSEAAWSPLWGYPKALAIYDQSLFAGFTPSDPRTIWASTLGAYEDFEPSTEADGSFAYAISGSSSQNGGQWLSSARRGIYIGALGEVYRGFSNAPGQRIGPTTFDTDLEATDGTTDAQPIVPNGFPVLITKDAARVLELRYSFETEGADPVELSAPSSHLGSEGLAEMVWQSSPQRLAWMRRDSGDMVVMLHDPREDVLGWAVYPVAAGVVETMDVTSSPAGGHDILTLVVRRVINGQTVRLVEEQAITYGALNGPQGIADAVHLFAASVFAPETPQTIFAVPHLIGETVFAWTELGELGPLVVPASGNVELDVPVSSAVIGLFDDSHECETLDITAVANDGDTRGRIERLDAGMGMVLHRTSDGLVAPVERDFNEPERVRDWEHLVNRPVAGGAVTGVSGTREFDAISGNSAETSLRFKPVGGAPMTVLAIVPSIQQAGA